MSEHPVLSFEEVAPFGMCVAVGQRHFCLYLLQESSGTFPVRDLFGMLVELLAPAGRSLRKHEDRLLLIRRTPDMDRTE